MIFQSGKDYRELLYARRRYAYCFPSSPNKESVHQSYCQNGYTALHMQTQKRLRNFAEKLRYQQKQWSQRALLRSRAGKTLSKEMFRPGDKIYAWYHSSKRNEKDEWIAATVTEPKYHYIEARKLNQGRPMGIAYEDVRFQPQGKLTQE